MALSVARGGQGPDLKPSHTDHILMTQGARAQNNKKEREFKLRHADHGYHARLKGRVPYKRVASTVGVKARVPRASGQSLSLLIMGGSSWGKQGQSFCMDST